MPNISLNILFKHVCACLCKIRLNNNQHNTLVCIIKKCA